MAILTFSLLFRALTSRLQIAYLTPLSNSKSAVVHLPNIRSGWIPGQHVRIRVLTGGMGWGAMECHPFTLASAAENGKGAKLVVKVAGDWTGKLFDVAQKKAFGDVEGRRGYPGT